MKPNIWNIKDMFSFPPGSGMNRPLSRNAASSDHSSQTDSQLLNSQCCLDNSQPGSFDYKSQANYPRSSNPNSQESEPSFYQKFMCKPPLCPDNKDSGPVPSFGAAKGKSIVEQFEESKKKAKERQEGEQFNQMICKVHETVEELKTTLRNMEEHTSLQCQSVLGSVNAAFKSLTDTMAANHESTEKTVLSKCNFGQALLDLENKIILKDAEMTDLKSNIQLLLANADALKTQLCKTHLEMSEKFTWLSDSIKSSEDKILSEIHKINWPPKQAPNLKDNMTQTSPVSVQDLPMKEHITSQFHLGNTCLDGSTLSQSTCNAMCHRVPLQPTGNLCRADFCSITHCVRSAGDTLQSTIDLEASGKHKKSDFNHQGIQLSSNENMDDAVAEPQRFYHNDSRVPMEQGRHLQNTKPHNGKGKRLPEKNTQTSKSVKAKKPRKNSKKNRAALAIKNTTRVISRAATGNSQYKSGNESVIYGCVGEAQDCDTLYTERFESLLPVIPAPVRKVQKKNSLKSSMLGSRQTTKRGTGNEGSINKTECTKDYGWPTLERDWSHYSTDCESNMLWFPPSSPALSNTSTSHVLQTGQKNFVSLFFDSSGDSV